MITRLVVAGLLLAPALASAQSSDPVPAAPTPAPAPAPAPAPVPPPPTVAQSTDPAPAPAVAATVEAPAPAPPHWYDTLQVNGFASVAYSYNPADPSNQLHVFDTDARSVNVDVVEVVVQKPIANPGDAGFRVDLTAGSRIPRVAASAGLFRDSMGNAGDFDLQQAMVSYVAKVGRGLRLDAGKFVTHTGYEVIEGYDGYDDNYSRSILFGYAIPFTHTGLKASLPFNDHLSGMLCVVNGWDNVVDNNSGKTIGAQLGFAQGPVTAYLNYLGGPEQTDNDSHWRHLVDVVAMVKPVDKLTLGVNGDYAHETQIPMIGDATWDGVAAYARYDVTGRLAFAARGEVFQDPEGARTGTAQTLVEGTLTPTVKVSDNFVLRGDLRLDRSDVPVFATSDAVSHHQVTIAVNAIGLL